MSEASVVDCPAEADPYISSAEFNLRLFAAAQLAAGLQGNARLHFPNGQHFDLPLADALHVDDKQIENYDGARLDMWVYSPATETEQAKRLGSAVLFLEAHGEKVTTVHHLEDDCFDDEGHVVFLSKDQQEVDPNAAAAAEQAVEKRDSLLSAERFGFCQTNSDRSDCKAIFSEKKRMVTCEFVPQFVLAAIVTRPVMYESRSTDTLWQAAVEFGSLGACTARASSLPLACVAWIVDEALENKPETAASHLNVSEQRVIELAGEWKSCGYNYDIFSLMGQRCIDRYADEKIEFLVEGMIPFDCITLIAGENDAGKSTMLQHLAILAGQTQQEGDPQQTWLGRPVTSDRQGGVSVFISGEDNAGRLMKRFNRQNPNRSASRYMHMPRLKRSMLKNEMEKLRNVPNLRVVIIDPATHFLDGDENRANDVSEWYEYFQEFAEETRCAIIIAHHTNQSGHRERKKRVRGHSVWLDRPRVALFLERSANLYSTITVLKNNTPIDKGIMCTGDKIRLKLDPETYVHHPVSAEAPAADQGEAEGTTRSTKTRNAEAKQRSQKEWPIAQIVAAVRHLNTVGLPVTRTGRRGIYARRPPELNEFSRSDLQRAVELAIKAGYLVVQDDGRLEACGQDNAAGAQSPTNT